MKKIKKSIDIASTKEKVWEVLQKDNYTRQWYSLFMEGSHAITDWKVGSKVTFSDLNQNGLIGKITTSKPHELLIIEYNGILNKGKEDHESAEAQTLKGHHESYKLSDVPGSIQLDIEADLSEGYFDFMSTAWDSALKKIKELSESN